MTCTSLGFIEHISHLYLKSLICNFGKAISVLLAIELYKGGFNYAYTDDLKRTSFYYCANNRKKPVIIHQLSSIEPWVNPKEFQERVTSTFVTSDESAILTYRHVFEEP